MQSSLSRIQPEAIIDWFQNEMNYRPLAPYIVSNKPSPDSLGRVCRGNMIPVFSFLINRVKAEKTVSIIRRNIIVHGRREDNDNVSDGSRSKSDRKGRKRSVNVGDNDNREMVEKERELAEKEVERLRRILRRQRKELKARMVEVSREEADRKRMLHERSNYRLL